MQLCAKTTADLDHMPFDEAMKTNVVLFNGQTGMPINALFSVSAMPLWLEQTCAVADAEVLSLLQA